MIYIGQKNVIFTAKLINWENMKFNNLDNTKIFDDFFQKYHNMIDLQINIDVYNSTYQHGKILFELRRIDPKMQSDDPYLNDTPYLGNVSLKEIIRSNIYCGICSFSKEEEFAIIAHEIGHFDSYYKNLGYTGLIDEMYSDQYALKLGLGKEMESALQKMIGANPPLKTIQEIIKRITSLKTCKI